MNVCKGQKTRAEGGLLAAPCQSSGEWTERWAEEGEWENRFEKCFRLSTEMETNSSPGRVM